MEWLLTISVLIFYSATVLSVLEEWPKQGLTDTSYICLIAWFAGTCGIGTAGYLLNGMTLTSVSVVMLLIVSYALKLKLYDHRQYWKGLSLHALRLRGRR